MKVTVCELPNESTALETVWQQLIAHVHSHESEFALLPEQPFLTIDIDLANADRAKNTYPRYVSD